MIGSVKSGWGKPKVTLRKLSQNFNLMKSVAKEHDAIMQPKVKDTISDIN